MSKIIVAIDFSDCSINAFLHALSIAQHCASDMILIWVQKPTAEKDKFEKQAGDPSGEVKKQFDELNGLVRSLAKEQNIRICTQTVQE